jgi:hypothetical protein
MILLTDQSQWSLFLSNLLNFHWMFIQCALFLWIINTSDPLNFASPPMSEPHMYMVSTY